MAFIDGPSTEGPGAIVSKDLSELIRSHKDRDKDSAPYYHKAVKFYEGLAKQLLHQGHVLDLFACTLDQVGVAELKVAVERTGGLVVLVESFGHSVFKDSLKSVFQSGDHDLGLSSNDGEFLLIEAAFHLSGWINPETSDNCVFIRQGDLHIVPKSRLPSPKLIDSLKFLTNNETESCAVESIQIAVKTRTVDYPERARRNMHQVRVRVPTSVAQVLKHEPCLISLAVKGIYDRDIDTMKFAAKMDRKFYNEFYVEYLIVNTFPK